MPGEKAGHKAGEKSGEKSGTNAGRKAGPAIVARDGVLVDGYHRWQAHVRENVAEIPAENLGNLTDAEIIRESIRRNASHGRYSGTKFCGYE